MTDPEVFAELAQRFEVRLDSQSGRKQTEEFFFADLGDGSVRLHLHDYDTLYRTPLLYDAVLFGALKCRSPYSIIEILARAEREGRFDGRALRVLEIGAGSGLFGALLRQRLRPARLIGLDLSPSARKAAEAVRPEVYDDFITADVTRLDAMRDRLGPERFNFIGGVSATGPGHIPPEGLDQALALLEPGGLFLFHARGDDGNLGPSGVNIHAAWLETQKRGGLLTPLLDEPCFHRRAADGRDIFYKVVLARKSTG